MHPNPAFRQTSAADALVLARQRGFGVLAVNGAEGPLAAHIPFEIDAGGTTATVHLARSNGIARAVLPAPAVLIVSGPDAYVSPDWYGVPDQVPTWNYVAVHLRGTLHALPDEALRPHLDAVTAQFEARLLPKKPWVADKMSAGVMARMMRGIRPFRLEIAGIDSTVKLSQNKEAAARAGAAAGLAARPDAGSQAIAALMRADPKE